MRIVTGALRASILLYCLNAAGAEAQSYSASPSGYAAGGDGVIEMRIDTSARQATVRKVSGTFQKNGTMLFYEQGSVAASSNYYAGASQVTFGVSFGFTSGSRSYYAVAASSDGNQFYSGTVQVTATQQAPAAPSATATAGAGSVTISWNAVSGATRYKVTNLTTGQETDNLYTTSYVWSGLSNGMTYCFEVRALNTISSLPSAQKCARTLEVAPAAPQGVTATPDSSTAITIRWQPVYGQAVTRYKIEDQETKVSREIMGESAGSYQWTGLASGKQYCYVVRALTLTSTTGGISSLPSAQQCARTSQAAPAAPQGVTATPDSSEAVTIRWQPVYGQAVTRYKIEDQETKVSREIMGESASSYQWNGLVPGKQYCYVVRALTLTSTTGGISSLPSAVACASSMPATPASVVATAITASDVVISWASVSGATRYKVRNLNSGVETGDITTGTSHTWPGLTSGTSYCFTVIACAAVGSCSAPSAPQCATPSSGGQQSLVLRPAPVPLNAATGLAGQTTFRWSVIAENASQVQLEIRNLSRGWITPFTMLPGSPANTYTYQQALSDVTAYAYRFRATSASGAVALLPADGSFYSGPDVHNPQGCAPPSRFDLGQPGSGSTVPVNTTLRWSPSAGAAYYDLYLWKTNGGFETRVGTVTSTEYAVDLQSSTAYSWKVRARAECQSTVESASGTWTFTTGSAPTTPAGMPRFVDPPSVLPDQGTQDLTEFTWRATVENAARAYLSIRNPETGEIRDFPMVNVSPTATGGTFEFKKTLVSTGNYQYRVTAISSSTLATASEEMLAGPVVFGPDSGTISVAIEANPTRPLAGEIVNFVSNVNATNLTYAWTFGDGGSSSEPNPSHTYSAPGTYDVTLTVTRLSGSSSRIVTNASSGSASHQIVVDLGGRFTINGVVRWENGQAAGGAYVEALQWSGTGDIRVAKRLTSARTDHSGRFALEVPVSGDFFIQTRMGAGHYGSVVNRAEIEGLLGKTSFFKELTVPLPIVFIHGYLGKPEKWDAWDLYFGNKGYPTLRADYRDRTADEHSKIATETVRPQIEQFLDGLGLYERPKFHIVAHSKGGLVARALVGSWPNARNFIRKIVTLGTPNNGSYHNVPVGYLEPEYLLYTFNKTYPTFFGCPSDGWCYEFDNRRVLAVAGTWSCFGGTFVDSLVDAKSATTIEVIYPSSSRATTHLPATGKPLSHIALGSSTSGHNLALLEKTEKFFSKTIDIDGSEPFSRSCDTTLAASASLSDVGEHRLEHTVASASTSTAGTQVLPFDFEGGPMRVVVGSSAGSVLHLVDPSGIEHASAFQANEVDGARVFMTGNGIAGRWTLSSSDATAGWTAAVAAERAIAFATDLVPGQVHMPGTIISGSLGSGEPLFTVTAIQGVMIARNTGAVAQVIRSVDDGTSGDPVAGDGAFSLQIPLPQAGGLYSARFAVSLTAAGGMKTQRIISLPLTVRSPHVGMTQTGAPAFLDQDGDGSAESVAVEVAVRKPGGEAATVRGRLETASGTMLSEGIATVGDPESEGSALLILPFANVPCSMLTAGLAVDGLQIYDDAAGGVPSTDAEKRLVVGSIPSRIACGQGELAARFRPSATSVLIGQTVAFTNDSLGSVATALWDFGDGTGSTERNASHVYTTAGEYAVRLAVSDGQGRSDFTTETVLVTATAAAPTGFVATATSATSATLTWNGSAGAQQYEIALRQTNGTFAVVASTTATSYTAGALAADTAYVVAVRAVDSTGSPTAFSAPDVATTTTFTDDPLIPGATTVRARHLTELHTAVNALRAAAGLPSATFAVPAGARISAAHVTEVRTALDAARAAAGLPPATYTTTVASAAVIRAADVMDLRSGVR
jgi:PKD repeat protein